MEKATIVVAIWASRKTVYTHAYNYIHIQTCKQDEKIRMQCKKQIIIENAI